MGLRINAYAKINLSLEVIGRRDDGYHEIATILQTVDLADTVTLQMGGGLTVECDDASLSGEGNIVWRAAVVLANHAGIAPNVHIGIEKRIPVAAGLGGGSADAAAALRGLNRLWGLNLSQEDLASVAASLGSDVPFLVNGGAALATGRGEQVRALSAPDGLAVLLVTPAQTIEGKTPTLYGALRSWDFSDGAETHRLTGSVSGGNLTSGDCRNAFARAALEIFPGLADVWERTGAITRHPPQLSGAGPAIFCMPSDEGEHNWVADALRDTGARAYLVRTINPAWVV